MNRIVFVLFFILLNNLYLCYSQNMDVLRLYNSWYVVGGNDCDGVKERKYGIIWGDSVIGGIHYHKLYISSQTTDFTDIRYNNFCDTILLYRSEGAKVYRYYQEYGKDVLIYNFDLSLGDEFLTKDNIVMKVTEIFSANNLSPLTNFPDEIRAYKLQGITDLEKSDIWIENVGSIKTGIFNETDFLVKEKHSMSFYHYSWSDLTFAFPISYNHQHIIPFRSEIPDKQIINDYDKEMSYLNYDFKDDSLHVYGIVCIYSNPYHILNITESDNVIKVRLQPIFQISSGMDGISMFYTDILIPGFAQGVYRIETDDYLAHETPDTTIVCYGSVTDIQDIKAFPQQTLSTAIYDLQGRRLYTIPDRGIYIQNGKKYVVR